jgi:hypothetical protein
MPAAYNKCIKDGGKVRTKDLGKGKYMHICSLNGKTYPGEVKTRKEPKGGSSPVANAIANKMGK